MKITTPLFSGLLKALRSNGRGDSTDAILTLPAGIMATVRIPLPMNQSYFNTGLVETPTNSFALSDRAVVLTNRTLDVVRLIEGTWEISWNLQLIIGNSLSPITNTAIFMIIPIGATTGAAHIATIALDGYNSRHSGTFIVTTNPDRPIALRHSISGGGAVGTDQSQLSIIGNRLL